MPRIVRPVMDPANPIAPRTTGLWRWRRLEEVGAALRTG